MTGDDARALQACQAPSGGHDHSLVRLLKGQGQTLAMNTQQDLQCSE